MQSVHASLPEERDLILAAASGSGVFTAEEVRTVAEMFDDYVASGAARSGYHFCSCRQAGRLLGFACWGPTPLTDGTWDLYWICTAREAQKNGVGRSLFEAVETSIRAAGGRLIVIYTSSTPAYAAARRFYEKMGCSHSATITDYYRQGDDLLIYSKHVAGAQ